MVGISQIVGCGVIVKSKENSSTGGGYVIAIDRFVYNGVNNEFLLADPAVKVLDVYIENGVYPDFVPIGATASVTIDAAWIMKGNIITVKYQK